MIDVLIAVLVVTATATAVFAFKSSPEQPTPPAEPAKPAAPAGPLPPATPQPPAQTPPAKNVLAFTQQELQAKMDQLVTMANQSGSAKVEYLRVKLEQSRMLISANGQAMGLQGSAEDMEVRFEGMTMFVSGKVSALGLTPDLVAEVLLKTESGVPSIEIKNFRLGALGPRMLGMMGISPSNMANTLNEAVKSRGFKLPADVESIRIEGGKLLVTFK